MQNPRRLALIITFIAALLVPSMAAASVGHAHRCRTGYSQKRIRRHHRHHIVCVKKSKKTKRTVRPNGTANAAQPSAPAAPAPTTTPPVPPAAPTPAPAPSPAPSSPGGPPAGAPPAPPTLGGPPPVPAQTGQNTATRARDFSPRSVSGADAYVGHAYAADVACDGALSAYDFIPATGTSHEAGFLDMSPDATPGSAFSSQWVAARELMFSYSRQQWMTITGWSTQIVSQPDPNIVNVGDTSGSPFRFNGELGNYGWVYIATQYYWWTGSQWAGGTFAFTNSYLQSNSLASRTTGNSWCYLS